MFGSTCPRRLPGLKAMGYEFIRVVPNEVNLFFGALHELAMP
jgi:hypothetical protein